MRRLLAIAALVSVVLVAGGAAADTFAVNIVTQNNTTITLGWTAQPGYGYLFSADGTLVSRTNDPARTSVKFAKNAAASYDVDVIVKGANGHCCVIQPPPPPKNQCEDSIDNDGDGKIDFPADPGCSSATDNDETDAPPPPPPTGFPNASNTGVPAGTTLTAYTGPGNVTTANTVITGKTIGCISVSAPGVVIRNSKISCAGDAITVSDKVSTSTVLTVEDTEIDCKNTNGTGVNEADFTLRRVNIHGCENGLDMNQNVLIEDSYIHDLYNSSAAHADGIQFGTGHWNGSSYVCGTGCVNNITIRHNTIYGMGADGSFGTSAIIDHSFGPNTNILIDSNLLAGGAATIYCSIGFTGTNYRVTNNSFSTKFKSTVGFYFPSTECSDQTQSGNVIYETGQPLHLD